MRIRWAYAVSSAPETYSHAYNAEDHYDDNSEDIQSLQEEIALLWVQSERYQQREAAGYSANVGGNQLQVTADQGRNPIKDLAMEGDVETNPLGNDRLGN